jgi:hypothetical protein
LANITRLSLFAPAPGALAGSAPAAAHPGGVDAHGCHCQRSTGKDWHHTGHCREHEPPNRATRAPAGKSRENLRHDAGSPNYSRPQYPVACPGMKQGTSSGGRPCQR